MKALTKFLQKVDSIAPDPWYIDGVKQSRPTTQLGFMMCRFFESNFNIY